MFLFILFLVYTYNTCAYLYHFSCFQYMLLSHENRLGLGLVMRFSVLVLWIPNVDMAYYDWSNYL